MRGGDRAHDGQPEARSARVRGAVADQPAERLEQPGTASAGTGSPVLVTSRSSSTWSPCTVRGRSAGTSRTRCSPASADIERSTVSVTSAPEIERSVLVDWEVAKARLDFSGHPGTVYVRATDAQGENVRRVLSGTLNPEHPSEVQVARPSDALAAQRLAESSFSALFPALGGVALLVGGVGVANAMVISVLERRREVGLRRALGATRRQVRGQFLAESVLLSGLGVPGA